MSPITTCANIFKMGDRSTTLDKSATLVTRV